ncbi:MAG: hypothetical protein G01um101416_307 [Microgenomates group bacterium Gr01-1014_16]|nr:MAG: hypothetical protein G01um101416_307 [Microgenomates group bacterium Gr01-1014_16]
MSTDSAILVARRFVELVKKQIPVSQAYLFGSYAKNRAVWGADIGWGFTSPALYLTLRPSPDFRRGLIRRDSLFIRPVVWWGESGM